MEGQEKSNSSAKKTQSYRLLIQRSINAIPKSLKDARGIFAICFG